MRFSLSFPIAFDASRFIIFFGLLAYMGFAAWSLLAGSSVARALAVLAGCCFVGLYLAAYRGNWLLPVLVLALCFVGVLVSPLVNLISSVFFILSLLSTICITIFIRDHSFGYFAFLIPLKLFSLALLYLWVVKGYSSEDFNTVFSGYSRNGVGAIVLALMVGHVWYCYEKNIRPSIIFVMLGFILMFPLYGRSNIFFAAIVFLVAIYMTWRTSGIFIFSVLFLVFVVLFSGSILAFLEAKTNFSSGGESLRFQMLLDYWLSVDVKSLFFGLDMSGIEIIKEHGENPHNAFLRIHAFFGVFFTLFFFFLACSIFYSVFNLNFIILVLSLVFLGRAFFDVIYFGNIFDYMLWGPILHYYRPDFVSVRI